MTNHSYFPTWRCNTGFTIEFDEYSYSWSPDTAKQRKYVRESSYLENAKRIYHGDFAKWFTVDEFKTLCIDKNYAAAMKEYQEKMKDNVCPECSAKLVKRQTYNGAFWGCSNYSKTKCNYMKNIPSIDVR